MGITSESGVSDEVSSHGSHPCSGDGLGQLEACGRMIPIFSLSFPPSPILIIPDQPANHKQTKVPKECHFSSLLPICLVVHEAIVSVCVCLCSCLFI